ncbi:hypothetical protein BD311DRAFT_758736 [Dichomitus squalens]|uniref:Yippee domain-containing protein n=1 Tax=Dichomitus squalens TaxID=114155 RepID=A0A4Q9MLB7_9APHY|nr:hypothetical protein BD311DRAFT_758736 [Dichomitus squalens]
MSKLPSPPLPPLPSELDPVAQAGPPRAFTCTQCRTRITHTARLVSTAYRGHAGKAALFSDIRNIALDPPSILLMDSGAYTIQEFICATCETYLGWKLVRAHDAPERWKEGHFILELDFVEEQETDDAGDPVDAARPSSRIANGLHRRTMSAADPRPPTPKGVRQGFRSLQAGAQEQRRVDDAAPFWQPR